jgi:hypothetical protein
MRYSKPPHIVNRNTKLLTFFYNTSHNLWHSAILPSEAMTSGSKNCRLPKKLNLIELEKSESSDLFNPINFTENWARLSSNHETPSTTATL